MKRSGADDFWQLSDTSKYLPRETREYVPLILAAIIVAKNPVQYGFQIAAHEPFSYEKVAVPKAVDLRRVAEWAGVTIDEIQALNPELRRWTTPVKYEYEVKVPVGTADKLQTRLAAAAPADLVALRWHTVKRGESLQSIARRLQVSRTDLAEANQMSVRSKVRPGQQLIIPRAPTTLLATRTERPAPAAVASRAIGGSAPMAAANAPSQQITYKVKRGDTLFSIARLFDTSVDKIKSWNRLRGSQIAPGDRLKILASRAR
jgi:membrane-bound lytic murein transglycosylase D